MQSFRANRSLKKSKLRKLSTSTSTSTSKSISSLITIASSLSTVQAREILIAMPDQPFTLADLKLGYQTIKNLNCCFDISTKRIIKNSNEVGMRKNVSIIEISNSSELTDREFLIHHFAVKATKSKTVHTIYPKFCNECRRKRCGICHLHRKCVLCEVRFCEDCATRCSICRDMICDDCMDYLDVEWEECTECDNICCPECCDEAGVCNECNIYDFDEAVVCNECNNYDY